MKKLFFFILVVMSMFSLPSWGATVESIYKDCKRYQAKGFIASDFRDAICATYFTAMLETLNIQCQMSNLGGAEKLYPARKLYSGVGPSESDKVITSFINWAENNTDKWEGSPAVPFYYTEYLSEKFPCKAEPLKQ